MPLALGLKKRHLAAAALPVVAVAVLALAPQLLGERLGDALAHVGDASVPWLWFAGVAFAGSLAATAAGWTSALRRVGATLTVGDAAARYCTGSLVNALAPARLGSAVRLALFSRTLAGDGRLWTAGGVATSIGAVRALWLAVVLALASAGGVLPRWPIALLLLGVAVASAIAWWTRDTSPGTRWAHALDVFRELGRCPRAAGGIVGWIGLAMALRVSAAAGVAAAFGVERPLAAALLVIPALDLANVLPLTPGNVGVASAAVAFALGAHGAAADVALPAGIAFGAVEMLTTLALGAGSLLYFAAARPEAARWRPAVAGATACLAVAGAFGATVIFPLV